MKIGISNLAWLAKENQAIYKLLHNLNVKFLEIAPSIFTGNQDPYDINGMHINQLKETLKTFDLTLSSMQSIHFGYQNMALFETKEKYNHLLDVSKMAIDFASKFNIPNIVFGSPKVRVIPNGMNEEAIHNRWSAFFSSLAEYAQIQNTIISLEPNSQAYGTNFATNTAETIQIVRQINHPKLQVNLDMGTFILENDNVSVLENNFDIINHIHISSPFLKNIYSSQETKLIYQDIIKCIQDNDYNKVISIEMLKDNDIDNQRHVELAVLFLQELLGVENV